MKLLKYRYIFFLHYKLYAFILVILISSCEFMYSQEDNSLWSLDLKEIQVNEPRIDYKQLLQDLLKVHKVRFNQRGMDDLAYEYTYTGISDKEVKETGKAIISILNNKKRWYSKYLRINDLEYYSVDSSSLTCEIEDYSIDYIFYDDPLARKIDNLYHTLRFKNSEVDFKYNGTTKMFTLTYEGETKAEYYFDLDNRLDSIIVYKYPTFIFQPFIDKEIEKEDISDFRAVYVYGDSHLEHANSMISYIRDTHQIELRYELNILDDRINRDQYLLMNSDDIYLPTTFTFEKAWRLRKR